MEINVRGTLYPLKASIAFLNEIEKTKVRTIDGEKIEMGLANAVISIRDMGDVRVLIDTIMALNIRQTPRLNKDELTEWFEEGEVDLEKLGSEVIDFFIDSECLQRKAEETRPSEQSGPKSLKELTDSIAVDCFRYFGFKSIEQVLLLDLREYRLLCRAHRLQMADRYYWSA